MILVLFLQGNDTNEKSRKTVSRYRSARREVFDPGFTLVQVRTLVHSRDMAKALQCDPLTAIAARIAVHPSSTAHSCHAANPAA